MQGIFYNLAYIFCMFHKMRHPKIAQDLQSYSIFAYFLLDKLLTSTIAKCGISLRHLQKKNIQSARSLTPRCLIQRGVHYVKMSAYGTGCLSRSQRFESYSAIIEILRSRSRPFFSWSRSRSNSAAPASPVGKLSKLVNY